MSLTINLRNISWKPGKPAPKVCDYQYEVFVNTRCIESGIVRNHKRAEGWDSLVLALATSRDVREQHAVERIR